MDVLIYIRQEYFIYKNEAQPICETDWISCGFSLTWCPGVLLDDRSGLAKYNIVLSCRK